MKFAWVDEEAISHAIIFFPYNTVNLFQSNRRVVVIKFITMGF